ncbi:MAG TPA: FprA family A-type flavoprotein [bacterium]|nr:FprA family A-type flavoprotein [bacterium]HOL49050.1 FprA family A-type flavoprotein [bacterium]HPO51996.1 FprA family A-type flavoprotein [bacterium]
MKITEGIFSVGSVDWDLKEFHGYSTPYGTTYNSYLITGEKNILIDTVKPTCTHEFLQKIERIVPVEKIDYVISNHAEMDHSGFINWILSKSNATLICSPKGKENLEKHFHTKYERILIVENGQTMKIGPYTYQFFLTPMVHWPDSMCTYLIEKKMLFSNDAFGQHFASSKYFVDEVGLEIVLREAKKYYANIVNPYGNSVKKVLAALSTLQIDIILPSHGMIWRNSQHIKTILDNYNRWASNQPGKKVLIVYETMWGSTKKMAEVCYVEAVKKTIEAEVFNLQIKDISDVVAEMPDAEMVLFGSSILHGQILPKMAGLITYLTGLKFINRKAWTFGSYGWAKGSFNRFETNIKDAGFDMPYSGFYIQFVPDESSLEFLRNELNSRIFNA